MLAFAAVIFSPAPGTLSGRTIRSRPTLAGCVKKTTPKPPRSVLSSPRPARSSRRPWVPWCLRALAAALALALCPPDIIPAHASSIGERLKPSTRHPCEDVQSYYGGLEGLSGDGLMPKLGAVVSPHASLRYKMLVWEALKILDAADADHPEASSEVIEIYSQRAVPKLLAGKPDGWNREHLWPRSYGLKRRPSLTDLHNIRPADANVNSSKGNKYYGGCAATSKKCSRPANREAAPDTETDSERWAPLFQVRGDVARSLMYMAVSYGSGQQDAAPHLELSDSSSIRSRYSPNNQIFCSGVTSRRSFSGHLPVRTGTALESKRCQERLATRLASTYKATCRARFDIGSTNIGVTRSAIMPPNTISTPDQWQG
ncbi:extracellular ribonuclease-like [Triticum aestivum]|uniref:extracellular ribonuclease-like n=1 Tax=Triticum aestivum TaxID=4565 RepID=UPI001D01EE35|nr:extracellular ribonuclease-like [Triticum aestivum]